MAYFQAANQQERETDHFLPTSAKVTKCVEMASPLFLKASWLVLLNSYNTIATFHDIVLHTGDISRPNYHIGVSVAKIIPRQIEG